MAYLWNNETGQREQFPNDSKLIQEHLDSQKYGFRRDEVIPLQGPDGRLLMLPAEQAISHEVFKKGYTWSQDAAMQYATKKAYEEAMTGVPEAVGFASGMTVGLSDYAYAWKFGQEAMDQIRATDESGYDIGQAVGVIASVVNPIGAVARGAQIAEAGAAAGVRTLLGTAGMIGPLTRSHALIEKMVPRAIGLLAEGGMIGLGEGLSDAAVGRGEVLSEHTFANIGLSAALNLTGAAVIGGAFIGSRKLVETTKDLYRTVTNKEIQTSVAKAIVKTQTAWAKEGEQKAVEKFLEKPELITQIAEEPEFAMRMGQAGARIFDKTTDVEAALRPLVQGEAKFVNAARLIGDMPAEPAFNDLVGTLGKLQDDLTNLKVSSFGEDRVAVNQTERSLKQFMKSLTQSVTMSQKGKGRTLIPGSTAKIFELTDKFKRSIGLGKPEVYKAIQQHLENPTFYGPAAHAQREVNAAFSAMASAEAHTGSAAFFIKGEQAALRKEWKAAPDKIAAWIKRTPFLKGDTEADYIIKLFNRQEKYARTVSKYYEGAEGAAQAASKNRQEMLEWYLQVNEHVSAKQGAAKLAAMVTPAGGIGKLIQGVARYGGSAGGAAVGGVLGGPVGAGLGAMAGAGLARPMDVLTTPWKTLNWMARVRTSNNANLRYIRAGIEDLRSASASAGEGVSGRSGRTFLKRLGSVAAMTSHATERAVRFGVRAGSRTIPVGMAALGAISYDLSPSDLKKMRKDRDSQKQRRRDYIRLTNELARIGDDPDRMMSTISSMFGEADPDVPTEIKAHMARQLVRSVDYLMATAPSRPQGMPEDAWDPPADELAAWTRRVVAVEDPLRVLDHTLNGMVTDEEVETLKVCYPELYASLQEELIFGLANEIYRLPTAVRASISTFMGAPIEETQSAEFLAGMQRMHQAEATRIQETAPTPHRDQHGRFSSRRVPQSQVVGAR